MFFFSVTDEFYWFSRLIQKDADKTYYLKNWFNL